MRAPGSGTAGRSARGGLVLLQSPAFRKAYIIRRWEEGWGSGRSGRIPAFPRSLVLGRKQGPYLFHDDDDGRGSSLVFGASFGSFILGHYCKGQG